MTFSNYLVQSQLFLFIYFTVLSRFVRISRSSFFPGFSKIIYSSSRYASQPSLELQSIKKTQIRKFLNWWAQMPSVTVKRFKAFIWKSAYSKMLKVSGTKEWDDFTPGMQNCSVYQKSNWDEANFPCTGSITTPRSKSYRTSGLTPLRNL